MASPKMDAAKLRNGLGEVGHLIAVADACLLGAVQLAALGDSKRMVDAMRLIVIEAARAVRDAAEAHKALITSVVNES